MFKHHGLSDFSPSCLLTLLLQIKIEEVYVKETSLEFS